MPTLGKAVPVAKSLPVVGSMFEMLAGHQPALVDIRNKYGDVVLVHAGPPGMRFSMYCVFSPTGVEQVLSTKSHLFRKEGKGYTDMRAMMGDGLLNSQDETHRRQRRILHPLFTNRAVDTYADLICEEVVRITGTWEDVADVYEAASAFSLRVMARTLLGTDIEKMIEVYQRTIPFLNNLLLRRGMQPRSIPLDWPTPTNRKAAAYLQEAYDEVDDIIMRRRSQPETGSTDMISKLAQATDEEGNPLSVVEIRDNVRNLLVVGKETVSDAVAFSLHLLGKHPEIQEKCRAEVMAQIGSRKPLPSDVVRLPYLTCVVKETLRLYPSVPQIERKITADAEIDGYHIPAGSTVWTDPWVSHRNPTYWPDPERFDPDRFRPENAAARPRYAYYPFGGGGRACIGQYYSMLQCVLAIALVLRDYRLETIDQRVKIDYGISLQPTSPMRCRVTPMRG